MYKKGHAGTYQFFFFLNIYRLMRFIVETSFFGNFEQAENPKVLVVPVPYEYTTNYGFGKGVKNGPQAILNASVNLDSFDDELWSDISSVGINTASFIAQEFVSDKSSMPFKEVENVVRNAVIKGFVPVLIGGEHSLSYGATKAVYDLYPDVSLLHISAGSNLKNTHKNNSYSHNCTTRRIIELMPDLKVVQAGIRRMSNEEAKWIEKTNPNLEMFFARDKKTWSVADILSCLSKNVYITFNFDALDPSIMPSTMSPEPGGFMWEEAIDILKNVCTFKEVVGMDFVGLSPVQGLYAPDYLAAKLIYKTIGYTFARELGAFEDKRDVACNVSTSES